VGDKNMKAIQEKTKAIRFEDVKDIIFFRGIHLTHALESEEQMKGFYSY
jgi:hypothetical protein